MIYSPQTIKVFQNSIDILRYCFKWESILISQQLRLLEIADSTLSELQNIESYRNKFRPEDETIMRFLNEYHEISQSYVKSIVGICMGYDSDKSLIEYLRRKEDEARLL